METHSLTLQWGSPSPYGRGRMSSHLRRAIFHDKLFHHKFNYFCKGPIEKNCHSFIHFDHHIHPKFGFGPFCLAPNHKLLLIRDSIHDSFTSSIHSFVCVHVLGLLLNQISNKWYHTKLYHELQTFLKAIFLLDLFFCALQARQPSPPSST